MYEFDVNYTNEEYMEYYVDILIKRKIVRNVVFVLLLLGIAAFWFFDKSDNTGGNFVPIFSLAAAVLIPLTNFLYIPMVKKQLRMRENEVKSIAIHLTFNEDEIIYENNTVNVNEVIDENPEVVEEEKPENVETEEVEVVEEEGDYETEDEVEQPQEKVFTLHYNNFYEVRQTKNLVLMSLDRETVIIIPKRTIQKGNIDDFLYFLGSKIAPFRFKIKGVENTFVYPVEPDPVDETENSTEQENDSNQDSDK